MHRSGTKSIALTGITRNISYSRGRLFGLLIIAALFAFELFNYSTTDFALNDLLGGLRFAGIRWATILAIAFCGIDFAGIARLFSPEGAKNETREVWYLLGAWLLAASMNAMLTWWGVALAIVNHQSLGSTVVPRETLIKVVPVFVAIMVWLIRVLIIGTLSVAGNKLYSQADSFHQPRPVPISAPSEVVPRPAQTAPANFRPLPKSPTPQERHSTPRPDPTYHPAGMSSYSSGENQTRQ